MESDSEMNIKCSAFSSLSHGLAIAGVCLVAGLAGCSSTRTNDTATTRPTQQSITSDPTLATEPPDATSAPEPTQPSLDLSKNYGDGITLATSCSDFIQEHDSNARYDAAIRMSSDFAVDSPGNPMWGMNMDSVCGGNPDITLGDYFGRAGLR